MRWILGSIGIALLLAVVPARAPAAYFMVDTATDAPDMNPGDGVCQIFGGGCALRAAVEEGNALAGPDAAIIPAGTYTVATLQVTDGLVLGGAGAEETIIAGDGTSTVIQIAETDVALLDLTVTGASGANVGGGIGSYGTLTLINCTVRDNQAQNVGGGIYQAARKLTIVNSTISNNFAFNVGGGIHNAGNALIVNSTISGNRVLNTGGGISNEGSMRLSYSTVTLNGAGNTGCGVENDYETSKLELDSSVLANNRNLQLDPITFELNDIGPGPDCRGSNVTGGYNLIQTNLCPITQTGPNQFNADALLGSLQDNGGQTPTHALPTGSPAIDFGDAETCPSSDQRGVSRPYGLGCDSGAYETTACGNGALDAGEACDDSNGIDGDGCDSNCTLTGCGNAITTTGEQCDDGNLLDGDCCSSTCTLTIDDDLVPAAPGGAKVLLRESASGQLSWKWSGGAPTSKADLGDPTASTTYTLCLVDENGAAPALVMTAQAQAGEMCDGASCWKETASGFQYKSKTLGPGRLAKLKLKASATGGKILVKGKGRRLRMGRLPLLPPVRMVLRKSEGSGTFGANFGTARSNGLDEFKATSD